MTDVDHAIGIRVAGLAALGQRADLVIVADYGRAATAADRVVRLDALADPADFHTVETETHAAITPVTNHETALMDLPRRIVIRK